MSRYVSHSSTVRHSPQRARTRPRTGIRMRWWHVGQGKETRNGPRPSDVKAYGTPG